jgi:hypothetical protein
MCKYTKPPAVETQSYQLLKVAVCLQLCTKQEMQSMIKFLSAEGVKPMEVYTRMLAKYRTSYVSKTQVCKWVQKFKNRVQIVEDSSQPGKARRIIKPEITAVVDDLIQENHFITISEIAMEMKLLLVLHTSLLQKSWTVEKSVHGGLLQWLFRK